MVGFLRVYAEEEVNGCRVLRRRHTAFRQNGELIDLRRIDFRQSDEILATDSEFLDRFVVVHL